MDDEIRQSLDGLSGKELDEAATTYLLGLLDVDTEEDLERLWGESFDADGGRELEQILGQLGTEDHEVLLRLAMEAGADLHPDSDEKLQASVDEAGQSLFVLEVTALALAAALLIREHHAKGRESETKTKIVIEGEKAEVETTTTKYSSTATLAKALAKLGLGGGP
jgi:hypothetical protein